MINVKIGIIKHVIIIINVKMDIIVFFKRELVWDQFVIARGCVRAIVPPIKDYVK